MTPPQDGPYLVTLAGYARPEDAAETFNRNLSAAPLHIPLLRLDASGEIDIGIRRAKQGAPEWSPGAIVGWLLLVEKTP